MVKWFRTYCFMQQFCYTQKCEDLKNKITQKCCGNCKYFKYDYEEFYCKIHEIPRDKEFFPCGTFCKDFKLKEK